MKTISQLEIGQHFKFFRRYCRLVYLGYIDGEYHYQYVGTSDKMEVETELNDVRVTPLRDPQFNELIKWKCPNTIKSC